MPRQTEKWLAEMYEKLFPFMVAEADKLVKQLIEQLPRCEKLLLEGFELLFAPRYVLRQLILVACVEMSIFGFKMCGKIANRIVIFLSRAERDQRDLLAQVRQPP